MFTIINYGVGNLGSISNMLAYLDIEHRVSAAPKDVLEAERLLLPGVGSFDFGMTKLNESGLTDVLQQRVCVDKVPVMGICLGMQIMCQFSEEGQVPGLGWFDAKVKKFDLERMDKDRPIPHTGWNDVRFIHAHPVSSGLPLDARFYFVHGYHVECDHPKDEWMQADYGYPFTAALASENKLAVQFHPEKSHKFGLTLLKNFAGWSYAPS
jgi:glutamine amidotransferase